MRAYYVPRYRDENTNRPSTSTNNKLVQPSTSYEEPKTIPIRKHSQENINTSVSRAEGSSSSIPYLRFSKAINNASRACNPIRLPATVYVTKNPNLQQTVNKYINNNRNQLTATKYAHNDPNLLTPEKRAYTNSTPVMPIQRAYDKSTSRAYSISNNTKRQNLTHQAYNNPLPLQLQFATNCNKNSDILPFYENKRQIIGDPTLAAPIKIEHSNALRTKSENVSSTKLNPIPKAVQTPSKGCAHFNIQKYPTSLFDQNNGSHLGVPSSDILHKAVNYTDIGGKRYYTFTGRSIVTKDNVTTIVVSPKIIPQSKSIGSHQEAKTTKKSSDSDVFMQPGPASSYSVLNRSQKTKKITPANETTDPIDVTNINNTDLTSDLYCQCPNKCVFCDSYLSNNGYNNDHFCYEWSVNRSLFPELDQYSVLDDHSLK